MTMIKNLLVEKMELTTPDDGWVDVTFSVLPADDQQPFVLSLPAAQSRSFRVGDQVDMHLVTKCEVGKQPHGEGAAGKITGLDGDIGVVYGTNRLP